MIPAKEKHLAIFKKKFELLNEIVENKRVICDKIGISNKNLGVAMNGEYSVGTYMAYNDIMSEYAGEIEEKVLEIKKM